MGIPQPLGGYLKFIIFLIIEFKIKSYIVSDSLAGLRFRPTRSASTTSENAGEGCFLLG